MTPVNTLSLVLPGLLVPARWLADAGWRARLDGFASVRRLSRAVPVRSAGAPAGEAPTAGSALPQGTPRTTGGAGTSHDDPGRRSLDDRLRSFPHERWLAARFGLDCPAAWCAATAAADGAADARWRVDPVQLQAGLDHVSLVGAGAALAQSSGRRDPAAFDRSVDGLVGDLVDAVAPLLSEEGLALRRGAAGRWYLADRDGLRLLPATPGAALGRSIDGLLPRGEDARRWRRILTEIEMTWHEHPANDALRAAGAAPVTSLWLTGPVPRSAHVVEAALAGTDPSLAGVAVLAGARHVPQDDATSLSALRTAAGEVDGLLLHAGVLEARRASDAVGWLEAWPAADALLEGALAMLDARVIGAIDIVATGLHRTEHRRLERAGLLGGLFGRRASSAPGWLQDDEEPQA